MTEQHIKGPLILYNYPRSIKPFYMRCNEDGKTVAAMDVLVPGVGEIIGGSQREERLDVLLARMKEMDLHEQVTGVYRLATFWDRAAQRFGLGLERVVYSGLRV